MKLTKAQTTALECACDSVFVDAEVSTRRHLEYNGCQDATRDIRYQDYIQARAWLSGSRCTALAMLAALGVDDEYARLSLDVATNNGTENARKYHYRLTPELIALDAYAAECAS